VATLLDAGATLVGRTSTDELSRGIFGGNAHYGTPENPRAPGRVPGGSSCGSAAAVAGGLVDIALGTDTGGSVRIPASFCGLYGMRTTHGRIPLDGVIMQAASYDTVGWFTRDADLFARVTAVMLGTDIPDERPAALIIVEDAFAVADPAVRDALMPVVETAAALIGSRTTERLCPGDPGEWRRQQGILQGHEAWASFGDWVDRTNPRFGYDVAYRFVTSAAITAAGRPPAHHHPDLHCRKLRYAADKPAAGRGRRPAGGALPARPARFRRNAGRICPGAGRRGVNAGVGGGYSAGRKTIRKKIAMTAPKAGQPSANQRCMARR
jgi:amidase